MHFNAASPHHRIMGEHPTGEVLEAHTAHAGEEDKEASDMQIFFTAWSGTNKLKDSKIRK